ncbi:MAG TPA: DUF1684 domain-containing protein [Gaiellaceae bacterium]|nr:DUF1684 domain-containing protein [Gaiellaceae bacterium]
MDASVSELTLLDWKRRIFALYAEVRADGDHERAWRHWCATREELYRSHPQSPRVGGIPDYFDYDPALRFVARVDAVAPALLELPGSAGSVTRFRRFAAARFRSHELELYWLDGYGGGVFLPFRDETSGVETYGAGRYLLDTVKGADLGGDGASLVLDFNFAFNPSCAWNDAWACPLAPPANRLPFRVAGGERTPR